MTILQQYYYQQLRRRQTYLHALKIARISNLLNLIKAGVDVANDPLYKEEYLSLITEFGPAIFVFELSKLSVIIKEENNNG